MDIDINQLENIETEYIVSRFLSMERTFIKDQNRGIKNLEDLKVLSNLFNPEQVVFIHVSIAQITAIKKLQKKINRCYSQGISYGRVDKNQFEYIRKNHTSFRINGVTLHFSWTKNLRELG